MLGGYMILHPTMREAKARAIELCADRMRELKAEAAKYEQDAPTDTLVVTITNVQIRKLTPQALCEILNTNGSRWMEHGGESKPIVRVTMTPRMKQPRAETVKP